MHTKLPHDPNLDLADWVGQRSGSFTFQLINGVTGQILGDITPFRAGATLTHDTASTIKRQLNIGLNKSDTAEINPLTDRIIVAMVINGTSYPLGRYMFSDFTATISTGGDQGVFQLTDEMFLVDQEITEGFDATTTSVDIAVGQLLEGLPIDVEIEASPFIAAQAWPIGTTRGQILEALALSGDYFSPWFDNNGKFRMIRSFDPHTQYPDFDLDSSNQVIRQDITETSDLITSPNRFVVVSNASPDPTLPIFATVDIPPTAPHSIANRGFVIASVQSLPVTDKHQALAVAQNLALRQTVYQRTNLATAPDPRHDSYNVVIWQEEHWLELSWSLPLNEGGTMSHLLRKAYPL